jgi:hypothetical protein
MHGHLAQTDHVCNCRRVRHQDPGRSQFLRLFVTQRYAVVGSEQCNIAAVAIERMAANKVMALHAEPSSLLIATAHSAPCMGRSFYDRFPVDGGTRLAVGLWSRRMVMDSSDLRSMLATMFKVGSLMIGKKLDDAGPKPSRGVQGL